MKDDVGWAPGEDGLRAERDGIWAHLAVPGLKSEREN